MKRISQEEFNILKSSGHVCPMSNTFRVGGKYKISNPENKDEVVSVVCTQNCPHNIAII